MGVGLRPWPVLGRPRAGLRPFGTTEVGTSRRGLRSPRPCTGGRGGLLAASRTAELPGWPGFPCKPAVVHQARAGTKYLSPQPVLHAAWCSALLRSRAGGSCLKPAVNQSLRSFPLPFPLSPSSSYLGQISTSPPLLPLPFSSIRNQSFPLPHRPFQHPPVDSLSRSEKRREGGDLDPGPSDKPPPPSPFKDTTGLVRAERAGTSGTERLELGISQRS